MRSRRLQLKLIDSEVLASRMEAALEPWDFPLGQKERRRIGRTITAARAWTREVDRDLCALIDRVSPDKQMAHF